LRGCEGVGGSRAGAQRARLGGGPPPLPARGRVRDPARAARVDSRSGRLECWSPTRSPAAWLRRAVATPALAVPRSPSLLRCSPRLRTGRRCLGGGPGSPWPPRTIRQAIVATRDRLGQLRRLRAAAPRPDCPRVIVVFSVLITTACSAGACHPAAPALLASLRERAERAEAEARLRAEHAQSRQGADRQGDATTWLGHRLSLLAFRPARWSTARTPRPRSGGPAPLR